MADAWDILKSKSTGTTDAWDLLTHIEGGGGDAGVYPPESKVLLGTDYGPTGVEYTGTLTGGTGIAYLRRR